MSAQIFYNNGSSSSEIITHLVNSTDGAGLHFDGTSGYIDIATVPDLGTKLSFEFIIQAHNWGVGTEYIFDFGTSGRTLLYNAGNNLALEIGGASGLDLGVDVLGDGKVHHLVLAIDGTSLKVYDNANEVASKTIALPTIDAAVDGVLGARFNGSTTYCFNGTFYRARLWNRDVSADVQSLYENASLDFADQWGSQTSLVDAAASVFTSGVYGWVKDGSNTIANVSNTLAITYVNNASGAYNYLRNASDLTTDLTVGKKYRLTVDAKYAGGSSGSRLKLNDGANNFYSANLTTSLVNYTFEFTARTTAVAPYIQLDAMTASNVVTIDNWYVREIGCAFDLDLAYANPTQSTIVQNRSGSGDATTVGGVTQISPIEAVNTNKLNVGGTTPLVGIGLAAGVTPARMLQVNDATEPDILLTRTAGVADSTSALGNIYFGNQDTDKYLCQISAIQDGTKTSGRLEFATDPDGSSRATRLSISSAGLVQVSSTPSDTVGTVGFSLKDASENIEFGLRLDAASKDLHIDRYYDGAWHGPVMTFDRSSGDVEVNNAAATAKLLVMGTGAQTADILLGGSTHTNAAVGIRHGSTGVGIGSLSFLTSATDGALSTRLSIDSAGRVSIGGAAAASSNLQVHETGSGDCRIVISNDTTGIGDANGLRLGIEADEGATLMNHSATNLNIGTGGTNRVLISGTTGLTTVTNPGWPLKNELTNSGFDVWSNSTLENATGTELAVDGTFSDTANWTEETGWAVTGGNAVATSAAADKQIYQTLSGLTVGKLYRAVLTCSAYTSGNVAVRFNDVDGPLLTGTGTSTVVVEATTATPNLGLINRAGSSSMTCSSITLYEATPGCVAGAGTESFDGWWKTQDGLSIYRQHSDDGGDANLTKDGSFYALRTTTSGTSKVVAWPNTTVRSLPEHYQRFNGRKVTFGCWAKTTTANHIRLQIDDGGTPLSGSYVSNDGDWHWLELTDTINADGSMAWFKIAFDVASADGYISQPMLVFGSAIGSGNYSRPSGEVIYNEKDYDSVSYADAGTLTSNTTFNSEAESLGRIPKGAKALNVNLIGSPDAVGSYEAHLQIYDPTWSYGLRTYGNVVGNRITCAGWVKLNSAGEYRVGKNQNFSELKLTFLGVQM